MRGNPRVSAVTPERPRSIPASAGEPAIMWAMGLPAGVYPRECGGTDWVCKEVLAGEGLSPRVRGNPTSGAIFSAPTGSIPASAGEPSRLAPSPGSVAVYPRECGGTQNMAHPHVQRTVYPRECGGTDDDDAGMDVMEGLSPRVRGNLLPLD